MRQACSSVRLAAVLMLAGTASAAPITPYTNYDDYLAAITGLTPETVQGFDRVSPPLGIDEGTGFGGLRFSAYDLGGAILQIVDRTDQTSSNGNALETDLGSLVGGDGFTLARSAPLRAFGLFVITADHLVDADISLGLGGGRVDLAAADVITGVRLWTQFDFADDTNARLYFLGAVAAADFTEVILTSSDAAFAFSLDDLRYSTDQADVPLPPVWGLLLPGLIMLGRRGAGPVRTAARLASNGRAPLE